MSGTNASKELLNLLNEAIAIKLQLSIQYPWQYVIWKGVKGFTVKDKLRKISIVEMKHAEDIAERLVYLGGKPTTKPTSIHIGESLKEMFERDRKDEEEAIHLCKKIIDLARKEGDEVTEKLFTDILADEEDHQDTFTRLLENLD
jgi:bacterioferritin